MNKFALAFKKARLGSDKTFRQIKDYVGLSIGYLSDMENGKRNPPETSFVIKFEEFFGITDGHLVKLARRERINNSVAIGNLVRTEPKLQEVLFRIDSLPEEKREENINKILEELRKLFEGNEDPWLYLNSESLRFFDRGNHTTI